eukprot:ctg_4292.g518
MRPGRAKRHAERAESAVQGRQDRRTGRVARQVHAQRQAAQAVLLRARGYGKVGKAHGLGLGIGTAACRCAPIRFPGGFLRCCTHRRLQRSALDVARRRFALARGPQLHASARRNAVVLERLICLHRLSTSSSHHVVRLAGGAGYDDSARRRRLCGGRRAAGAGHGGGAIRAQLLALVPNSLGAGAGGVDVYGAGVRFDGGVASGVSEHARSTRLERVRLCG